MKLGEETSGAEWVDWGGWREELKADGWIQRCPTPAGRQRCQAQAMNAQTEQERLRRRANEVSRREGGGGGCEGSNGPRRALLEGEAQRAAA